MYVRQNWSPTGRMKISSVNELGIICTYTVSIINLIHRTFCKAFTDRIKSCIVPSYIPLTILITVC